MDTDAVVQLTREALRTGLIVGAPVLVVGMVVGLVIGLGQALTQIQDQTVSFVPKILAMGAVIAFLLPWLVQQMTFYVQELVQAIPQVVLGG